MPDTQSLTSALDALTQEEKERFLAGALSASPALLETIVPRLPLRDLPENAKARICFQMQVTPVGHAHRNAAGVLNWELPQVPEPLRPLVYSLSRLIGDSQAAMVALVNGRGDFTRAFELLNPTYVQGITDKIRAEMQAYSAALRDAGGRRPRPVAQPQQKQAAEQPSAAPKSKRANQKAKPQAAAPAQAHDTKDASSGITGDKDAASGVTDIDLFLEDDPKGPASSEAAPASGAEA